MPAFRLLALSLLPLAAMASGALAQTPLPEPDPREFVGPRIPVPEPDPRADEAVEGEPADDGPDDGQPVERAPAEEPAEDDAPEPEVSVDVSPAEACHARLADLDAEFSTDEPFRDGACGIAAPVTLSAVGAVAIAPPAQLECTEAEAVARWIDVVVVPAAEDAFGEAPTGVGQASAYVCRNRTSARSRLSEHALGRALDVAQFEFAGRETLVVDPEAAEAPFLQAIRRGACNYFTTVLGPGSDADHDTHLHLDLAERRRGYRLCQ